MAKWIYAALAGGWVLSMFYECVQTKSGAGAYFISAVVGVTLCAILFVKDLRHPEKEKPVPRMLHFLGAAASAALFTAALSRAAEAGSYVRFLPFYVVMFLYFLGAGVFMWWKERG